jgi:catecholate siderophore receptor
MRVRRIRNAFNLIGGPAIMSEVNPKGIRSFAKTAINLASLGASSLALSAGAGMAQQTLGPIVVTGERINELSSPRYTAPLRDTPQTVTVVSEKLISEQNLLNLRDILSTVPGITFGAGEGGGGYGDSINLRGYSANNDISTDGVRDSGQYSRTDPFNLEQIEVTSGANSVYAGSGSVGGSINLATKRPFDFNRSIVSAGIGTDDYGRVTADLNRTFGENVAGRLNLMVHQNDVPGRDVEKYERWGIAPSVTLGLGASTRATVLYAHQEDENIPQYGVPFAINAFNDGPLPGVSDSSYFGYSNVDRQEITFDSATLILEHDLNDAVSLRNLTRWQQVSQDAITSAVQGTFCVVPGFNPYTGAPCATPGSYAPSGPRGNLRDATNEILINQLDLTARFDTGALAHTLVVGGSISNETYTLESGNVLRNPRGVAPNPILPTMNISDPDHVYTGPLNRIVTSTADNEVDNVAFYAFDRIEFGPKWELNGGIRWENNEGESRSGTIALPYPETGSPTTTLAPPTVNQDDLFSYRVGLVYKPVENASIYAAYGNSSTPSQSTVNGSCNATTNCNVDPEEAVNYEIGGKYEAFGGNLLLTAAVFRNERTNFRVASGDDTVPEQQLDGSSKVEGVALGVSGLITENWSIFANYTYLDSEIEQNISDLALGGGTLDFQAGDPLPNTPEHSGSIWTTYVAPFGVTFGYGITYQGEYTFSRSSATAPLFHTDPYWVHRAMVSYPVTDQAVLQLNVNNLWDEEYYERVRNNAGNGWATPGAARSAVLSLLYTF